MTLYTPVVFTDGDDAMEALATARGWRIIRQQGTTLTFAGTSTSIQIPAPTMSILKGALEPAPAGRWSSVLTWIRQQVLNPMLVVGPNHPMNDLALWAHRALGWPHAAWINDVYPALTPSGLALVTSAEGVVFTSDSAAAGFRAKWPTPVTELPSDSMILVAPAPAVRAARRQPGVTRVLLVAYYAGPSPTVGVQRINYWFENLARLSEGTIEVDLALATPWPDAPAGVHRVPDLGPALASERTGSLAAWGRAQLESVTRAGATHSQDTAFWHLGLEAYFDARQDEYDVVVCSGNPFAYFEFARYAKRRWYAKTILDYRDPFALNPRTAFREGQRGRAVQIEAGWNMMADAVTVVNDVCRELVVPVAPDQRIEVIPNGFDERAQPDIVDQVRTPDSPIKLAHAGQIFPITPADTLLRAIAGRPVEFHHMGAPVADPLGATVVNHGRLPRAEVLERFGGLDCGVAYSTASGIETPTKVFDYLAAGLDVLLLHRGDGYEDSALAQMLDGVPGIHWVHDEEAAIADFLDGYQPQRHLDPQRAARFSRRQSTLRLIEVLRELGDHAYHPPAALRHVLRR